MRARWLHHYLALALDLGYAVPKIYHVWSQDEHLRPLCRFSPQDQIDHVLLVIPMRLEASYELTPLDLIYSLSQDQIANHLLRTPNPLRFSWHYRGTDIWTTVLPEHVEWCTDNLDNKTACHARASVSTYTVETLVRDTQKDWQVADCTALLDCLIAFVE
jgi:hypothetical protein